MQEPDNIPSILTSRFDSEHPTAHPPASGHRLGTLVLLLAVSVMLVLVTLMLS